MNEDKITLAHGSGGISTRNLIKDIFYRHFNNQKLIDGLDSAVFEAQSGRFAFTTDSFVVKPIFFSGGDIGKLAVCGTVNDLAVAGAKPLYLSCGLIIEEGFPIGALDRIAESMARTADASGVKIITGDTKVVEKGCADGIFINTSGVGILDKSYVTKKIMPGDDIIVTGTIAEHGTAISRDRYGLKVDGSFMSDCAPINHIIKALHGYMESIKLMKDPTRGGIATALNEIAEHAGKSIHIFEENIPIRKEVQALNELLGIDPLYLACEGRAVIVADKAESTEILARIRVLDDGKEAQIIGCFEDAENTNVYIENFFGGKRILASLEGNMLPRIC